MKNKRCISESRQPNKQRWLFALLFLLCSSFLFTACSEATTKKETKTYVYKDPEQCADMKITKSEYGETSLKVYMKPVYTDMGSWEIDWLRCFDQDLQPLTQKLKYTYGKGVLEIQSDAPETITGLEIHFVNSFGLKVRYLNSEQFAGLSLLFVDDVGEVESGDSDRYYTEEEKEKARQREERRKQEELEAFEMVKGHWYDPNGDSFVDISKGEEGTYNLHVYLTDEGEDADEDNEDMANSSDANAAPAGVNENAWEDIWILHELTYYYDEETNIYDIMGTTGDLTAAPFFFHYIVEKDVLTIDYSEIEFVKDK